MLILDDNNTYQLHPNNGLRVKPWYGGGQSPGIPHKDTFLKDLIDYLHRWHSGDLSTPLKLCLSFYRDMSSLGKYYKRRALPPSTSSRQRHTKAKHLQESNTIDENSIIRVEAPIEAHQREEISSSSVHCTVNANVHVEVFEIISADSSSYCCDQNDAKNAEEVFCGFFSMVSTTMKPKDDDENKTRSKRKTAESPSAATTTRRETTMDDRHSNDDGMGRCENHKSSGVLTHQNTEHDAEFIDVPLDHEEDDYYDLLPNTAVEDDVRRNYVCVLCSIQ